MNEKHSMKTRKDKIGAAGQIFVVEAITQTSFMKDRADQFLRRSIFPSNGGHAFMSLRQRQYISHTSILFLLQHSQPLGFR